MASATALQDAAAFRERVTQSAACRISLTDLGFRSGTLRRNAWSCKYSSIGRCVYAHMPKDATGAPWRLECVAEGCPVMMHVLCALESAPSASEDDRTKLHCLQHLVSHSPSTRHALPPACAGLNVRPNALPRGVLGLSRVPDDPFNCALCPV